MSEGPLVSGDDPERTHYFEACPYVEAENLSPATDDDQRRTYGPCTWCRSLKTAIAEAVAMVENNHKPRTAADYVAEQRNLAPAEYETVRDHAQEASE